MSHGRFVLYSSQFLSLYIISHTAVSNCKIFLEQWIEETGPSGRPRGLRRRSAAARPAETVGSNPTGGHGYLSVVIVVCCQVEVSVTSFSLVQRSPTDCNAPLCDLQNLAIPNHLWQWLNRSCITGCIFYMPLTFWTRNYFFSFSTPCILNANNTGTKYDRIMKQTAFVRVKNGEYTPSLKYSVHIFVE